MFPAIARSIKRPPNAFITVYSSEIVEALSSQMTQTLRFACTKNQPTVMNIAKTGGGIFSHHQMRNNLLNHIYDLNFLRSKIGFTS